MNKISKLFCCLGAGMMLAACSDDFTPPENTVIETPVVSTITESSAVANVTIYGRSVHEDCVGVCYSTTNQEPTINDEKITRSRGKEVNVTLGNLQEGTTYYLRAYAETDYGVRYSDVVSFTTRTIAETLNEWTAPEYVDDYRSISSWTQRAQWNLANVHDPSVMLADDGYYYMYQTDASYGNAHTAGGHFHARRSKNLIDWEYLGGTMTDAPAWVLTKLNEIRAKQGLPAVTQPQYGYWAPTVRKVREGLYRMYYSIVVDNYIQSGKPATETFDGSWGERAFIGMMETADPASNQWEDKGFVLCSSSDKGKDGWARSGTNDWNAYFYFNAIDPSFIITPEGEHWLIYGSWHSGFAAVQLNAETGKTITELGDPWADSPAGLAANGYGKRIFSRKAGDRWQGSEAPEVIYHDGYYYLFMAYDGLDVPYNTRVVRSENIDGPYKNINGTDCTNGGDAITVLTHPYQFSGSQGWVGIAHCAVFDDGQGNYFYASQQRFPTTAGGNAPNAVMLGGVRSIQWQSNGWPVVMPERYAAVPQVAITASEIAGTWEHIDLSYSYGNMKTSTTMTFNVDGSITGGPWAGSTWSFNAETNTLTANGVELKVQRECDWEADPRKHTIVYAGSKNDKTYWGKKK
ncbi:MAG: family 43 glycosylhydrolase [Prevotella sp.]|nr:family 43 glycosylhydrolase [Prevotella sp.]